MESSMTTPEKLKLVQDETKERMTKVEEKDPSLCRSFTFDETNRILRLYNEEEPTDTSVPLIEITIPEIPTSSEVSVNDIRYLFKSEVMKDMNAELDTMSATVDTLEAQITELETLQNASKEGLTEVKNQTNGIAFAVENDSLKVMYDDGE